MVLLAGTCFSLDFYKVELGLLPLTADRLLLALLIVQYFLWRRWGLTDPKPWAKPNVFLLLLLALLVASALVTVGQTGETKPLGPLVVCYLMPGAVYWIARQTKWSERAAMVLLGSFALFGIYLAITSLAEYFQTWWLVFPPYITASALKGTSEFVGQRGPLLHPIGNGILLATCLGSLLLWWPRLGTASVGAEKGTDTFGRHGPSGSGKGDRHLLPERPFGCCAQKVPVPFSAGLSPFPPASPLFPRLLLIAAAVAVLAAIGATLTRSVWMGGALAVALAVGLALPWRWRLPLLAGGLAAAGLLAAVQWDNLVEFKRDKALEADKTAESVELRPVMATVAWQMFRDRPLFGCGYNQYGTEHLN